MTGRFQELSDLYSGLSPLAFLLYCCHGVLRRISSNCSVYYYVFFRQPLSEAPSAGEAAERRGYRYSWYESFSPAMLELPRPPERLKDRFSQRTVCLLVHRSKTLVACAWFAFAHYDEDEARCRYLLPLDDECVWDYDVYVDPAYRLSRAFSITWQLAESYLYGRGYRYSFSRISAYNPVSLSSHAKLGAEQCGGAVFIQLWSLQLMFSNKSPFMHLSLAAGRRPELKFT
jgi:hypothetical protein